MAPSEGQVLTDKELLKDACHYVAKQLTKTKRIKLISIQHKSKNKVNILFEKNKKRFGVFVIVAKNSISSCIPSRQTINLWFKLAKTEKFIANVGIVTYLHKKYEFRGYSKTIERKIREKSPIEIKFNGLIDLEKSKTKYSKKYNTYIEHLMLAGLNRDQLSSISTLALLRDLETE